MPTKLSNRNFFISNVRQCLVSQPRRVRGILRCHVRVMLPPSFESEDCVHGAKISKKRPEHSDERTDSHNRNNNKLPRANTLGSGKVDKCMWAASKNQTKAFWMVIENQNAPYFPACRIY
jgi:hypothetical protein